MALDDIYDAVKLAVPAETSADRLSIAKVYVNMAIRTIGRMRGVPFNQFWTTMSLTNGKTTYVLGTDTPSALNVSEMWRTDAAGWEIDIVAFDDFNSVVRGLTNSGPPQIATVYYNQGGEPVLEVYPTPDSTYSIKALFRKRVDSYDDIPGEYDDVIYSVAVSLMRAVKDNNIAIQLAVAGLGDVRGDSMIAWNGSTIEISDNIGRTSNTGRLIDSRSLR